MDTKFYSFPENNNNDLATLLALNGNNRGWCGMSGWGGTVKLQNEQTF